MKQINVKKLLLPNLPYVFIALFATKLGQAARLAPGADFSQKALHIMEGFAAAFQSALPSFHPIDLCVGIAAALLIRLAVYIKGKNARKFRKNIEYGSARWGNAEDIKPYSKKYLAEHESDILLHKAAKNAFDELGVKKLPTVKSLQEEYAKLLAEKKAAYAEYRTARDEMRELLLHKQNVDRMLGKDERSEEKKQEHDRQ